MDVFRLAIGDHVHGFAALCNSLCMAGFAARIHVGYQGEIGCEIAAGAPIVLHELPEDGLQPMNRKAAFLLDHAASVFLYLDADIVVMNRAVLDALSDPVAAAPVFCAEGIVPCFGRAIRVTARLSPRCARRGCRLAGAIGWPSWSRMRVVSRRRFGWRRGGRCRAACCGESARPAH